MPQIVKHYLRSSQALPAPFIGLDNQAMLTPVQKKAAVKKRKTERAEFLKALGERIRERASNQSIKPSMIAAECHISRQAVNDWFNTGRIHKKHLPKLARLLNWTLFEMLGDTPAAFSDAVISAHAQYLAELFDQLPHEEQQNVWPALLKLLERTDGHDGPRPSSDRSSLHPKRRH